METTVTYRKLTAFLAALVVIPFLHRIEERAYASVETNVLWENMQNDNPNSDLASNITLAFLGSYGDLKFALGALSVAIDDVNNDTDLLPGTNIDFIAGNTGRHPSLTNESKEKEDQLHTQTHSTLTIQKMTDMKEQGVTAFIGPDRGCTTEALVAAAWNMPMISYACADNEVSDKNVFFTFARTLPSSSKFSKSVVSFLKAFKWHKFVLVAGMKSSWCLTTAIAIQKLAEQHNLQVIKSYQFSDYIPKYVEEMRKIVDESYTITRVYVFVGEHIALIDFMTCMDKRNLLDGGDYIVIAVDDEVYQPINSHKIPIKDDRNSIMYKGFRSVLKFTQSFMDDSSYKEIRDKIKAYSTKDPFNVPFHQKIFDSITLPVTAYHLYDAVRIYAMSLTAIMEYGGNIRNGSAVLQQILNKTFRSIRGYDVHIDENGDAEGNYSVVTTIIEKNPQTATLQMSIQPVGYFQYAYNASYDELPDFKYFDDNKTFQWVGGKKPIGEPVCGFHGEKCGFVVNWNSFAITCLIFLMLFAALFFSLRHYRYEQKLACLLWKVDMKDVTVLDTPVCANKITELIDEKFEDKSVIQENKISAGRSTNKECMPLTLAYYKGNLVVMRRIAKKMVDMNNPIRNEFINMKELRHQNLVQIIGACVEPSNTFILMEYHTRGNLQDVLINFDIKLDQMFISSIVSDILKGMIYLHQSLIGFHGNLRSSNCLVDSRWVLRISDFGLFEYEECGANVEDENIRRREISRKLYRAPEVIAGINARKLSLQGKQKCDVYSFGILLYEIIGRAGPWGNIDMSPEEIILKVQYGNQNNERCRPNTKMLRTDKFVLDCMEKCWHQEPSIRPEFITVRELLKGLHTGLKCNIFDNMLARMEKYSCNLEEIVRERTQQLSREKKRTEELLYEILPPSVAESLKNGLRVIAESYDCVTIYFSDIVGFTAMSAISTPLQVIDLLNELYTTCDSILSQYDVYKVETIGDAYMVASGLPLRNGNRHAGEIASMALHLLKKVGKFEIKHIPKEQLKIRIGIHSGSCVSGVIGTKMPRYCLFGDTVNTASRMEASGEPLAIHISETTKTLLYQVGGYHCVERGITHIKGKGDMKTYWLIKEDSSIRRKRLSTTVSI